MPDTSDPSVDTDTATDTGPGPSEEVEGICRVNLACVGGILDQPKTPCALQIVDAGGASVYDGSAAMELRGRSSLYFDKPQYALELRSHSELPVWPDSGWRYLDDGSNAGTAWREPDFDDASWATGPAPLGFGGGYLQTVLSSDHGVGNPSLTTYFRTTFTLGSPAEITQLDLGVSAHDGGVVYLNGVEIHRENLPTGATWDTPASRDVADDDYTWTTDEIDPALLVDGTNVLAVEVHRAGLTSTDLRFNLWLEASGLDQPTNLLGMGKEEDWILNGQYVDRSLIHNRLAFDLFQSLGEAERYAPELRFCELELNGEYRGIYTLGEKIERDDDRVDIAEGLSPGDTFIVKLGDGVGFHDNGVGYGTWEMVWPEPTPVPRAAVTEWLVGWEDAIHGPSPGDPQTGIFAWVDLASAVDWVLVQELMKNHDAYQLSVFLWKDEVGLMFFAPWDLDLSMGYPYTDCGAEGWVSRTAHDSSGQSVELEYVQAMADVPAFREALVSRWAELRDSEWSDEKILERLDDYDALLAPVVEANFERWPIDEIVFQTNDPTVDNWLCPVGSYEEEQARTRAFITDRLAWMDANIGSF